jgi:7-cyano-7-deazaguanine reductase
MATKRNARQYTDVHARAGLDAPLPEIECFENQFPGYQIEIGTPEFTSVCPKTGLPDHGTLTVIYVPDKWCLELKSLKMYWLEYRNLGIFQENVVNRCLRDIVRAANPMEITVEGVFLPRGGVHTTVRATWTRAKQGTKKSARRP